MFMPSLGPACGFWLGSLGRATIPRRVVRWASTLSLRPSQPSIASKYRSPLVITSTVLHASWVSDYLHAGTVTAVWVRFVCGGRDLASDNRLRHAAATASQEVVIGPYSSHSFSTTSAGLPEASKTTTTAALRLPSMYGSLAPLSGATGVRGSELRLGSAGGGASHSGAAGSSSVSVQLQCGPTLHGGATTDGGCSEDIIAVLMNMRNRPVTFSGRPSNRKTFTVDEGCLARAMRRRASTSADRYCS